MKPQIRAINDKDVPFIINSFLKSYKNTKIGRLIENKLFYPHMHDVAEALVERAHVAVACDTEDEDQILGYAVFEYVEDKVCVHYVYVKHIFRRFGIGKALFESIPGKPEYYTFHTDVGAVLAKKAGLSYCPYNFLELSENG